LGSAIGVSRNEHAASQSLTIDSVSLLTPAREGTAQHTTSDLREGLIMIMIMVHR